MVGTLSETCTTRRGKWEVVGNMHPKCAQANGRECEVSCSAIAGVLSKVVKS